MKTIIIVAISILILNLELLSQNIYNDALCDFEMIFFPEMTCNYNPYILVFEDNFDGNKLDFYKWRIPYQGAGGTIEGPEKQWYANTGDSPLRSIYENIQIANGKIKLTTLNEIPPILGTWVPNWGLDTIIDQYGDTTFTYLDTTAYFDYSSASIATQRRFEYGRFEIRCKIPKGKGFFPAFWTFTDKPKWNEIDVFEFWNEKNLLGNYDPDLLSRVHKMNLLNRYYNGQDRLDCPLSYKDSDFSLDFHTFVIEWTPYEIAWYVDNDPTPKRRTTYIYTQLPQWVPCDENLPAAWYLENCAFPHHPMAIITNLAIQQGSNSPDGNTPFPSSLEIDYIRYYKKIPCENEVVCTDISILNYNDTVFNVLVGGNVELKTNFDMSPYKQLDVIASNEIKLGPGFKADYESYFSARLDPTICNQNNSIFQISDTNLDEKSDPDNSCNMEIFPNPCKGKFFINLNCDILDICNIRIYNNQGSCVKSINNVNTNKIEVEFNNAPGLYLVKVINLNRQYVNSLKLVME